MFPRCRFTRSTMHAHSQGREEAERMSKDNRQVSESFSILYFFSSWCRSLSSGTGSKSACVLRLRGHGAARARRNRKIVVRTWYSEEDLVPRSPRQPLRCPRNALKPAPASLKQEFALPRSRVRPAPARCPKLSATRSPIQVPRGKGYIVRYGTRMWPGPEFDLLELHLRYR